MIGTRHNGASSNMSLVSETSRSVLPREMSYRPAVGCSVKPLCLSDSEHHVSYLRVQCVLVQWLSS